MAEEVLGKSVEQLKGEQSSAVAAFSRQADHLSQAVGSLVKLELQEEFSKLSCLARLVGQASQGYRTSLQVELEKTRAVREEAGPAPERGPAQDVGP
ncbi:unnamed protein product, partial [Tetraodon nigroviridis]